MPATNENPCLATSRATTETANGETMAPVGSPPPAVPHRRAMSYDDVVLQEAIRFARTPIERSFGGFAWSPSRRAVLTITHRLAHLIVRAERDRQYWTMVGAKYFLNHLAK